MEVMENDVRRKKKAFCIKISSICLTAEREGDFLFMIKLNFKICITATQRGRIGWERGGADERYLNEIKRAFIVN